MTRVTRRAGRAATASRPPLIAERCLRTAFISVIVAPLASRARLTACLSASVMPPAGSVMSAEPPPEIRAITRSSGRRPDDGRENELRRRLAHRVGDRMRGLEDPDPPGGHGMAVAGDDDARQVDVRPGGVECRRHRGRGLAGPDDDAATLGLLRQVAEHRRARIGTRDSGVEDPSQQRSAPSSSDHAVLIATRYRQTFELRIASQTASVTSFVVALPPTSGVRIAVAP